MIPHATIAKNGVDSKTACQRREGHWARLTKASGHSSLCGKNSELNFGDDRPSYSYRGRDDHRPTFRDQMQGADRIYNSETPLVFHPFSPGKYCVNYNDVHDSLFRSLLPTPLSSPKIISSKSNFRATMAPNSTATTNNKPPPKQTQHNTKQIITSNFNYN